MFTGYFVITILGIVAGVGWSTPTPIISSNSPDPATDVTLGLFQSLNTDLKELRREQKIAYDQFKVDRFSDPDIIIPPLGIAGMPDISGISHDDRFYMEESDLLELHRSNIQAFKEFMLYVSIDEMESTSPTDFGPQFTQITNMHSRVVASIEDIIRHLGYADGGLSTLTPVSLLPEDSVWVRYLRDVYILQENHSYLSVAASDMYMLFYRHSRDTV